MGISTDAKVGIFVVSGLAAVALAAFVVEPLRFERGKVKETYHIVFSNVAGLEKQAAVRVAGVLVGKVQKISITPDGKADVEVILFKKIPVHEDAYAQIETMGLMGEKYIELFPGSPQAPLLPSGGVIKRGKVPISPDQLVTKLYEVADQIERSFVNKNGQNRLALLVDRLTELTTNLNSLVVENRRQVSQIVKNVNLLTYELRKDIPKITSNANAFLAQLNQVVAENRGDIRQTVLTLKDESEKISKQLNELTSQLNSLIKESSPDVKSTLENVKLASEDLKQAMDKLNAMTQNASALFSPQKTQQLADAIKNVDEATKHLKSLVVKVDKGKGTIGKLFNNDTLYTELVTTARALSGVADAFEKTKAYIGFSGDVNLRTGDTRGRFSLKIVPTGKHYYYFAVVGDSQGSITKRDYYIYSSNGSVSKEERVEKSYKTEFTALYARNLGKWFTIKGGLVENTGGFGVDLKLGSRATLTSMLWDAGREDADGKKIPPHLRVGLRYRIGKHWLIYGGADELLYNKWRGVYIGSGLQFGDRDIKYLMGSLPIK